MLSYIRRGLSSFIVTVLLGLLVVSFAIWGIGDAFRFTGGNVLATVGDSDVAAADFEREFRNALNGYRQQSGVDITLEQAKQFGLPQQILEQMVSREAFDQAVRKLGLTASVNQVYDVVHAIPAFQNSFKEFDKGLYENVLKTSGLTPSQFESMARADIPRDQLLRTLGMSAHMPDELARRLFAYHGEDRTIDYLRFQASAITTVAEPAEQDLAAYYAAHKDHYMAPEYRALSYLVLGVDNFMQQVTVGDADLKAYYDSHLDQYNKPEQRTVVQIVVADKAKAEAAEAELKSGKDFATVAHDIAAMGPEDIALGSQTRSGLEGSLGKPVADAVFALDAGGVTAPIESSFGWHVLKVEAVTPGESTPLETVRASVEADVRKEKALDQLYQVTSRIEDDIAGGMTLEEIAKNLGTPLQGVAAVDVSGLTPDGSRAALPEIKGFLEKAFATEPGTDLELQETEQNQYYLLSVDSVTPKAQRPLEAVRTALVADWKAEQREEAARAAAEAARKALADGQPFATVKATANGGGQEAVPVSRMPKPTTANLPPDLKSAAFSTAKGQSVIVPSPDRDGVLLIRVTAVTPGNPESAGTIFAEFHDGVAAQYGNDALVTYRNYLQRELGTKYNEQLLKDTVAQINR